MADFRGVFEPTKPSRNADAVLYPLPMPRFPYEERAARAREASKAVMTAAGARRRLPNGHWDQSHPSFAAWVASASILGGDEGCSAARVLALG
jgi:hypothetical protein